MSNGVNSPSEVSCLPLIQVPSITLLFVTIPRFLLHSSLSKLSLLLSIHADTINLCVLVLLTME